VQKAFGPGLRVALAYNLTLKDEKFFRGSISEVLNMAEKRSLKGEFVLVLDNKRRRK
jgi:16S rRNA C1402 (ribose-2'-O) methylase RsmI